MVKWVHLNFGDDGLLRLFRKMHAYSFYLDN